MKRIISLIITLCLILSSFSFVFAEAWTNQQAAAVTNNVNVISNEILAIGRAFYGSLGVMYNSVSEMMSWMSPQGNFGTGGTISGLTMYEILDYIAWNIDTDWNSEFAQLNSLPSIQSNTYSVTPNGLGSKLLTTPVWSGSGWSLGQTATDWYTGIQFALNNIISMIAYDDNYLWPVLSYGYNAQLSVWDSQGNTLNQNLFTPTSMINGLYNYLAYTQRDVARLAYAYASDEELEAREEAKANQTQIFDDFIDPNGQGSVSTTDLGDMAGISSGIKDNLDTGVSAGGIFDVFTGNHSDAWFSQATYNELMGIRASRDIKSSESDYSTPLLDQQMNDLLSLFGGDVSD